MNKPSLLFQPYPLKNIIIKNRIFKSAMSEALATKDNLPSDKLIRLYRTWARGGAGVLVTGNVMVDRKVLGEPRNVVLENDRHLTLFKKWAEAGTENGTQLWMQINHPGKQVFKGVVDEAVAPSAVPFDPSLQKFFPKCRALTGEEITAIIKKFAETARLAQNAGFSGVQIHAAHGYLVSQFLSNKHNRRTDEWGGSIKNRFRFLQEIYKAVRAETGEGFPVSVKINSADFIKSGFSEHESLYVIKELADMGTDLIEISGGTYEKPEMTGRNIKPLTAKREAYFIEYAERLKKETDVPIAVTGGFRTKEGMEEALFRGKTDFIGIARPMAVYPALPQLLKENKLQKLTLTQKKTGISLLDDHAMLELTWYSQQLARIGKGKRPKPAFSPLLSLFLTVLKNGTEVFQKRRV
ncbi:NADH:flavin oxidoreductase/NADH oxidase family protein [Salipaludibacillus sp. CUR1]|uniref:NADH:flavin oxidoreductase/NADH oxidase family protein n=1 Tax=Salipaludibacillus sp. CUR1 TaxID=2820003 RepID=UPI001E3B6BD0|nr:NADH:flavin oxidoreductase/NADH oxidase family protein [Salipaludibacillus sp. CUR1]MCE7791985.1 NADH:flavin oxidoreductase/NADH oxidase family protein [Salipaludibacillus sp. CUR1]